LAYTKKTLLLSDRPTYFVDQRSQQLTLKSTTKLPH